MSIDSAKAYVERLVADSEFGRRVRDAPNADSRKKVLRSEGFNFSKAELDSVVSALSKDRIAAIASALGGANAVSVPNVDPSVSPYHP